AAAATEIVHVASARASLSATRTAFRAAPVDALNGSDVEARLARIRPDLVLHCASHQSPWEPLDAPSGWTALLRRAGFRVALPRRAGPAGAVARAVEGAAPDALFVNACFPDAVNPLLAALGLPILCGVGNVSQLAASLQSALGCPDQEGLQVLAHHVHLHEPA